MTMPSWYMYDPFVVSCRFLQANAPISKSGICVIPTALPMMGRLCRRLLSASAERARAIIVLHFVHGYFVPMSPDCLVQ